MQNAIVMAEAPRCAANAGAGVPLTRHDLFVRIGTLTRSLHDTLRPLGYDNDAEAAVGALPDARARPDFIATLTGKAADRVLHAAERAKTAQENIRADALALQKEWTAVLKHDADARSLFELGRKTQSYLAGVQLRHEKVDCELSEIVLAHDFHDLTGQVIQRVTCLARSLEEQLVELLLDAGPPAQRREMLENVRAGPAISAKDRDRVVTHQGRVDDLLDHFGF